LDDFFQFSCHLKKPYCVFYGANEEKVRINDDSTTINQPTIISDLPVKRGVACLAHV